VNVPTAVVVTTKDRLVRPRKQRQLAKAIPSSATFELHGDHDAAMVMGKEFPDVTTEALNWVKARLADGARGQSLRRTAG
jgi:homoserine acetyltransferase